jgi:hypothetical protein
VDVLGWIKTCWKSRMISFSITLPTFSRKIEKDEEEKQNLADQADNQEVVESTTPRS